ncbi:hypothetical protein JHK85_000508 [Glycine max]|nr:hypothetical protein JHK85_000508 [Glycine max]
MNPLLSLQPFVVDGIGGEGVGPLILKSILLSMELTTTTKWYEKEQGDNEIRDRGREESPEWDQRDKGRGYGKSMEKRKWGGERDYLIGNH